MAEAPFAVGTRVEVRNRFEAAFCPGFEVSRVEDGIAVRRLSDGVELPATFDPSEIRVADR